MKYIISSAILFATVCTLDAQITINSSNIFVPGDRLIEGGCYTNLAPNVVPGSAGASQTWNFATTVFDYIDTVDIYAPGWIPPAYTVNFPQATHAMAYGTSGQSYDLIRSDASGFYVVGSASFDPNFGVNVAEFQNYIDWMHWPSTYGQTYTDTALADNTQPTINGSIDSTRAIIAYYFTNNVDAWGTVTTSYGTYNAIRLQRNLTYEIVTYDHDSILGWQQPQTFSVTARMYEWWTNAAGIGFPIVSINVDPVTNAVSDYKILQNYTTGTGQDLTAAASFGLYPSPALTSITIATEASSGTWEIVDMSGRIVKSGVISSTQTQVDVAELQSGIYVMTIAEENGNCSAKRFVRE